MNYSPQPIASEAFSPVSPPVDNAQEIFADTIGQLMEFWGFKHIMGSLWAHLYLSPRPLSAPELCERLNASTGAISMALRDLQLWGAAHRVSLKESRKDHYVAEPNIWKLVSRVLSEREGRRIDFAMENLDRSLAALQAAPDSPDSQFQMERLEQLQDLSKIGKHLLKLLLFSAKIDVTPLQNFFKDPLKDARR